MCVSEVKNFKRFEKFCLHAQRMILSLNSAILMSSYDEKLSQLLTISKKPNCIFGYTYYS